MAAEPTAEWGAVTVGEPAAVYLAGERRGLPLCCPGGFAWRPKPGDEVLVLKAGAERERPYILGRILQEGGDGLAPGEVRLGTEACGVVCGEAVELNGPILIDGEGLDARILRLAASLLAPPVQEEE